VSEGVAVNMTNRASNRVLTTLVLVAAISLALGTEAHAAKVGARPLSAATAGVKPPAWPLPSPMSGEPDSGTGLPLPPKTGSYPTGRIPIWTLQVQMLIRAFVGTVQSRFP